jgi:probable rRNA maturation factor
MSAPRRSTQSLALDIAAAQGKGHVPFLRRQLRAAHAILRPPLVELSVALVGDRRMADLHEQFMGIPGPTDVLTFPLDEDARGNVTAGEVVVCVPEARRRAKANGVGVERELLLYALHGMLHLCGYDDRTTAAFRTMHATEDRILTQLGVGPVFDHGRPSAAAPPRSRKRSKARTTNRTRKANRATGAH